MAVKESAPYIVSSDVSRLMRTWARENNLVIPKEDFFRGMGRDLEVVLSEYFDNVQVVPVDFMTMGMNTMASKSRLPIISLDRAYVSVGQENIMGFLDVTRSVNEDLSSRGLSERPGTLPVPAQIREILRNLDTNKVALLDDVLFEGGTHAMVAEWLEQFGVYVEEVNVGIAIKDGAERLADAGINVRSLLSYDSVIDEICERDFIAGAPMSGRTVVTSTGETYGAPYFAPFGKPEQWASIPLAHVDAFSDFCIAQSLLMWEKVEELSGRQISTQEVPKRVFRLEDNDSIVDALEDVTFQERLSA